MTYLLIFVVSYIACFGIVFLWGWNKSLQAAARLRENGANEAQIANFHRQAMPMLVLLQPTFVFGTVFGALGALIHWVTI